METAFTKLAEKKCGGEIDFQEVDSMRWMCAPWKIVVEFPVEARDFLVNDAQDYGVSLRLYL